MQFGGLRKVSVGRDQIAAGLRLRSENSTDVEEQRVVLVSPALGVEDHVRDAPCDGVACAEPAARAAQPDGRVDAERVREHTSRVCVGQEREQPAGLVPQHLFGFGAEHGDRS